MWDESVRANDGVTDEVRLRLGGTLLDLGLAVGGNANVEAAAFHSCSKVLGSDEDFNPLTWKASNTLLAQNKP